MSNSNLHALSSPKSAMDTIQGNSCFVTKKRNSLILTTLSLTLDLELYPKDGGEEQDRTRDLRQIPSTICVSLKDFVSFMYRC